MSTEDSRSRWAALLIGTAATDSDLSSLPSVRHNLTDLERVLTDPQLVGMDPANVTVVPDPAAEHEVLDPLSRLADQDLDMLLVYYAGHGQTDDAGDLYLATTSTPNRADGLEWRSIEYRRVQRVVRRAVAGVRLVVLDCCFAGRALDVMTSDDAVLRGVVGIAGAVSWVASPRDKTAMAPAGERHTAFTGAFLGHITGDTRTPGADALTLATLIRSTRDTLRTLGRPEPQVQAQGNGLDLPIVRRPPAPDAPFDAHRESGHGPRTAPDAAGDVSGHSTSRVTPKRSFLLREETPELTAALERRDGIPLAIPRADEVPAQPLPTSLRSIRKWKNWTHSRAWQRRLSGFPSSMGTTWQVQVELLSESERKLFYFALMTEAVGQSLRQPAGGLSPVTGESARDAFWLNIDADGLISPVQFSLELRVPDHRPCTVWTHLPPTLDVFERDGVRSLSVGGVDLWHVTLD